MRRVGGRPIAPARDRRRTRQAARARAVASGLATLVIAASCAPHRLVPPPFPAVAREAVFRESLARREALGRAVDAEVTLWARRGRSGAWRGVTGALSLASPDAVRLRVASMFGTAFDIAVRGDTVVALLPARRLGIVADATRDAFGLRLPGVLGFRAFAATWRPPDAAWDAGTWSEGMLTLRWAQAGDSLRLAVGPDGLPAGLTLVQGDSLEVHVRYRAWMRHGGVAWPSSLELGSRDGELSVRCRIERARFRARPEADRLVVLLPAGTDLLDWPGFRRALEPLGAVR